MQVDVRERTTTAGETWTGRPRLAMAMRVGAFVAPVILSLVTTVVLAHVLPKPGSAAGVVLWWVGLTVCATGVLAVADRVARGLLPLAALFRLSLVFPDQAPSRFKAALRSGTVHQLEDRVNRVKAEGLSDDPVVAAETLIELVAALSKHDRVTRGHAERVRAYARMIGDEMGLDAKDADRLQWAALLHDVGKLFVPAEILNKPSALTDDEFEIIKTHPAAGAKLCEPLRGWLGDWVDAVGEHHEKWDGTGYPSGLAGTNISLSARIVAVADVYDVITSARSYKPPCTPAEAREELTRCAGTHFDPRVVRAFMSLSLGNLRTVMGPLSWLVQAPVLAHVPLVPASVAGSGLMTAGAVVFGGLVDAPHVTPTHPPMVAAAAEGTPASDHSTPRVAGGSTPHTTVVTVAGRADPPGDSASTTTKTVRGVTPIGTAPTTTVIGVTASAAPPVANRLPVADDEAYDMAAGTTLSVASPGLLANDSDANGDALEAVVRAGPAHGTVTVTSDGGFTYAPATEFSGVDSFSYDAVDSQGGRDSATVTITVVPVASTPTSWYLGSSGPTATTWDLVTKPNLTWWFEPDYDGDLQPGLTVKNSDELVTETDARKFHEWALTTGTSLSLTGPVTLQLWSAREQFEVGGRVEYSAWVEDCAANGADCTTVTSATTVVVDSWNGAVSGWGYQELSVGSINHTVAAGRQLRLRVMFDKVIWVALSGDHPSRLVIG